MFCYLFMILDEAVSDMWDTSTCQTLSTEVGVYPLQQKTSPPHQGGLITLDKTQKLFDVQEWWVYHLLDSNIRQRRTTCADVQKSVK